MGHVFKTDHDEVIGWTDKAAKVPKLDRDIIKYRVGFDLDANGKRTVTRIADVARPLGDLDLQPSEPNPLCVACGMFTHNCGKPFLPYHGSAKPLITVVFDSVGTKEDTAGYISADGSVAGLIRKMIDAYADETGVTSEDCRFVALSRCAHRMRKPIALKGKVDKCKIYAIQDFQAHPPRLIMPVGSVALGALCHKSNAQDWGGKMLTYRGWPDSWLTDPDFMKPRPVMVGEKEISVVGHPLFGPAPGAASHCLLFPIQHPRLIFMQQNELVTDAWKRQILKGLSLAKAGVPPLKYNLSHYALLYDRESVIESLQYIIDRPGMVVCYDTETTGLHPFHGDRIVFMMFRFVDPESNEPIAFGFPWDYAEPPASELLPHLDELRPYVRQALSVSKLVGHNITFDMLFTFCDLVGYRNMAALGPDGQIREDWRESMRCLNELADAARYDTWHMAYCRHQVRGSLGLEVLAYDYAPELAGYEEAMTLLIELNRDTMHPEEGGHYARCPKELWETHFKPYVLGDVETCARSRDVLEAKMAQSKVYAIPVAHTTKRGFYRHFIPPPRDWLYEKIMSPAARVLIKMMGRGMSIDPVVLDKLEREMPTGIKATIAKMAEVKNEQGASVKAYIDEMKATEGQDWELDLEKKEHLRDVLFGVLGLPIQRLTKTGRKLYGEEAADWDDNIRTVKLREDKNCEAQLDQIVNAELLKYAALDKFTLNKLAVDHKEVRPLQDYRKIYKLYNTYVRPLRNFFSAGLDKKQRTKTPHLCGAWVMSDPLATAEISHWDAATWLIHAGFMLTGTRGGRLCVAGDTQLEIRINGQTRLVAIKDLWLYNNQHVTIRTHTGNWKQIIRLYYKGSESMFEIITKSGCKIKATAGHRICTRRGWVAVRDLAKSDELRIGRPRNLRNDAESAVLCAPSAGREMGLSQNQFDDFAACGTAQLEGLSGAEAETGNSLSCQAFRRAERQRKWASEAPNTSSCFESSRPTRRTPTPTSR